MGNACASGNSGTAVERPGGCCAGSAKGVYTEGISKGTPDDVLDLPGLLEILGKVDLFKKLPQSEHPALAKICTQQSYIHGQILIQQGDEGDALYVISKGIVSVKVDGKQVGKMTVGECVGERALLRDEPRAATITAETPLAVITITRANFEEGGFKKKLHFEKRQAVGGGDDGDAAVVDRKPPTPKSDADRKQITSALLANSNLNGMVPMTKMQCDAIAEVCWDQDVPAGTEIIKQGDETDNAVFYIVRRGEFDVKVTSKTGAIVYSGQIGPGGSFGELALIYSSPRAATISAICDSSVWCVDRVRYQDIIADTTAKERTQRYLECIEKATFFDSLQKEEKEAVANALTEMEFEEGETIFEQGEIGTAFYILYDGEVAVLKNDKQVAALSGNKEKATIFGELALLTSEPRAATIKVVSEVARAMYMEKTDFDLLLGAVQTGGGYDVAALGESGNDNAKEDGPGDGRVRMSELEKIGILGCGGFGVVHFVVHKKTNNPYALKSLNKGHIIKCKMKEATMREKKIQMLCDSPFVVKLFETYNEPQALLFLMEVVLGGELYDLYERNALHGSENHAKYYVAAVALAFEHMHGKKIIYRDLKPENLLLTEEGRLKVTDMGLAKVVIGKTRTVCGTPDYFAPEMIAREGYTVALDWWTLGILAYELMVGKAPFAGDGNVMVQIKKGIKSVKFPPKTQGPLENLIKGLCETKPASRLPMKKGGSENIKTHDWFQGFDWNALAAGSLTPPFRPEVKSREAIKESHWSNEDMPPQLPYTDDGSGWDKDFASSS
mmetsp:Transcript_83067/g.131067  ORF Transcript_83067/g.131067 Transcript_83067/m.131067 type:complete len:786 (-) Transcript_83067:53-2410(-)|eukprot:CAMPEP_0169203752 /NCGR_PEP_ID=MMETSP1016-20121227/11634_1 /TAXON_ID=342587 /ORGANISM="Karlodinium micrum, Strain CCMP2283" /LENGTH=785 /DNA_ID=CAMNT_0009280817 /DNA_START=63 /DNA_END=2420 /DNA_ORIENTATION=-